MKRNLSAITGAVSIAVLAAAFGLSHSAWAQGGSNAQLQADVQHSLDNKRFGGVQVVVRGDVVVLNGEVASLADKLDAEKKAQRTKHVASVEDNLRVAAGERVNDAELQAKLSKALVYDRNGYGTTTFNAITLEVHNGVATIGGMVVEPADKASAISLITNAKGVQGLVDNLKVAPLSDFDNRIRLQEARAIYGASQLNRYAMDPAKPIRIAVENGHVTLVGTVDSEADRNVAGIMANGVSGVFSVKNDLQVAGRNER
jgi:hyperosmotically inducible protein